MCGLTGFWQSHSTSTIEMAKTVKAMASTLINRGPDDEGVWTCNTSGIAMGFRRLAILDLSPLGRQPMISESGRYVIVFNGELYNYMELRKDLEILGHRFRGRSDTEVILASTEEWGFPGALRLYNGMFAIALWDRQERTIHLARDPLGIKPLYYGWTGDTLLFGSELKSLRAHPEFRAEVDRGALTLYMRHGYVPGSLSIYQNVFKLQPGYMVTFHNPKERALPHAFWSLKNTIELATPYRGSDEDAIEEVHLLLRDAVRLQMAADVPLGAFLSGGIDSSLVVALMQSQSSKAIRTFSIGFREKGSDEAPHARSIAKHLGTEHTEIYVTPAEAQGIIPSLPQIYDEPFADSSSIPTVLLSRLTRRQLTVSLSGDGGDEVFGGYSQYWTAHRGWKKVNMVPRSLRVPTSRAMGAIGRLLGGIRIGTIMRLSSSLSLRAPYFTALSPDEFIRMRLSYWPNAASLVHGGFEPSYLLDNPSEWPEMKTVRESFMFVDTAMGLPDDMLTKVDRASSSVGLEVRVPLLDRRIVELSWRLPQRLKFSQSGQGKLVLRNLLRRYVPPHLFERPKQGFGVPIATWLRGPLRDWAEDLLDEQRLRNENFFDPKQIRSRWNDLLVGTFDWEANIWIVLMFQSWKEKWLR